MDELGWLVYSCILVLTLVLLRHLDAGGEPGAGGRFRLAGWSAVWLGCGGVSVKTFFVLISWPPLGLPKRVS